MGTWLLAETNSGLYLVYTIPGMLISGAIGALIGSTKNRTGLGFVLGALLGCIGWIIIAVMRRDS